MTTEQNLLKILSAKILKGKAEDPDDVKISYVEHFKDNSTAKIPGEFNRQPHPDFKEALKKLRVHLAVLADQIDISQTNDEALINKFSVHGFHITGEKNRGFVILGSKEGKYGRVGLNTRNILFESKTFTDEYPLSEILMEALETAQKEAAAYIRGKHLPDPQGNLFDSATTVQVDKPIIFPEQETDVSALYGIEPVSVLQQAEIDAKERLDRENVAIPFNQEVREAGLAAGEYKTTGIPQADPEAMQRVQEDEPKKVSKKKVKQTAETPSGEVDA